MSILYSNHVRHRLCYPAPWIYRNYYVVNMAVPPHPPLKPLHSDESLNPAKLATIGKLSTENLRNSLVPGLEHCLKTRPDGTILDGHHRIHILRQRGVDVDSLLRDVIVKE